MATLESLLRPFINVLNDNIAEVTPAKHLCEKLDGTSVAVRIKNTGLAVYFRIADETLTLLTDTADEPDIAVTGSFLTLARLATGSNADAIRDGSLELSGDVEVAQDFQRLLAYATPDVEERIAGVIGDAAAHKLGDAARGFERWASDARATMQENVREYLQEERRELPSRHEVERFTAEVNKLRDDVERLAAKVERLGGED